MGKIIRIRFIKKWIAVVWICSLALQIIGITPAFAATQNYLSLGDSVAFGYNPNLSPYTISNFSGYPDVIAKNLGLTEYNPSCPGETTQHFLGIPNAPDNYCGLYHLLFPLHVWYFGSQVGYMNTYMWLSGPTNTHLVTLQLGENNYWLLRNSCASNETCIGSGMAVVKQQVTTDLNTIIKQLRTDKYTGKIIIVNYYAAVKYTDPEATDVQNLNIAIAAAASQNGLVVADAFTAFKNASNGDPCVAKLLVVNSNGTCDVHPSSTGQSLIANTILPLVSASTSQ